MSFREKKSKGPTYLKYVMSYLLIVSMLLLGSFFIIRNQLTERFFHQRTEQIQMQLASISEWLNSSILHLTQVDSIPPSMKILR